MKLGISGRIAQQFQNSAITPLLAILGLLLGFFAIAITPKEEEPQIDVTFANVFIAFPGASASEVEQLLAVPAEQVLSELPSVDDIYSVSTPGMLTLTIAFEVGLPRQEAILNLYNQIFSHQDWLPHNLGVAQPVIKPMGIDDVPIMALTLTSNNNDVTHAQLTGVAHSLEAELKKIEGTRDIVTLGDHPQVLQVTLDPVRLNAFDVNLSQLRNSLMSANQAPNPMFIAQDNKSIQVSAGSFLSTPEDVEQLVVALHNGKPVYLADVAKITLQADTASNQVWHHNGEQLQSAVTIAIAKKPGQNAVDITQAIEQRLEQINNQLIPHDVEITISRDYGKTAKSKSDKLIGKLLFASAAVVVLVLLAMGLREAIIVGAAIVITLAITLFTSWVWGFTLNRVSLFALIFSIGILVDDAIVVVENIHRHIQLGAKNLLEAIPAAVDEVGGPTILATFTVIAALMPMAFVTGLMGPYMSPIPINASTGMLISLIIAFVVTPWLSYKLLKNAPHSDSQHDQPKSRLDNALQTLFKSVMSPFLGEGSGKKRLALGAGVMLLIMAAVALPVMKLVVLKMLPFDNKSEFQVVVDMPEGTTLEQTLALLQDLSKPLSEVPEVASLQLYAGSAAPINFNGLIRQYYLRSLPHQGDIQVNLVDKSSRSRQSHAIALSMREPLQAIGKQYNANVKIVEVPPGPPVMAPLVAEIYGPDYQQQMDYALKLQQQLSQTKDVVDVDSSVESPAPHWQLEVLRHRANLLGVQYQDIIQTISTALGEEDIGYLHRPLQKYALPIRLQLADADKADLQGLMALSIANHQGEAVPLANLIRLHQGQRENTIYHKNLKPLVMVTGDMAGPLDSPLYGMFDVALTLPDTALNVPQHYINQPKAENSLSIKWDGEWQITYETFRDMGIAYAVGMLFIYLLVVAQFKSYLVPLVIMAPIPLTIIGVMPGHALFGAQFTATSMIGMIALAGIIVRNSILLVDFINLQRAAGMAFEEAVIQSGAIRAKPIILTGLAAMIGAFFILDDPIFNGLAISLIFGILISTLLTLVVIPVLYYSVMKKD